MESINFYRQKTKLREGNVFTPVCDSVHRGGSLSRGVSVKGGLCPGFSVKGGPCPGFSVKGGPCPGFSVKGGLCPGFSVKGGPYPGFSVKGVLCPGGQGVTRWKSRLYASYWNASFFSSLNIPIKVNLCRVGVTKWK